MTTNDSVTSTAEAVDVFEQIAGFTPAQRRAFRREERWHGTEHTQRVLNRTEEHLSGTCIDFTKLG